MLNFSIYFFSLFVSLYCGGFGLLYRNLYGDKHTVGLSIVESRTGGYFVVGETSIHGEYDWFLSKWSSDGTNDLKKTFGGSEIDYADAVSVKETNDGGIAISGTFSENNQNNSVIMKFDSNLNVEWNTRIETIDTIVNDMVVLSSREIGVIGSKEDQFFVALLSALGELKWLFSTENNEEIFKGVSITESHDANIIVVTKINVEHKTGIAKLSPANGDFIFQYKYDIFPVADEVRIVRTNDDGFVISGCSSSLPTLIGEWDSFLLKINSEGIVEWTETFGEDSKRVCFSSLSIQNSDQSFIVGGYESYAEKPFLMIISHDGQTIFQQKYMGANEDIGMIHDSISNSNGDIVFTGSITIFGFLKLDGSDYCDMSGSGFVKNTENLGLSSIFWTESFLLPTNAVANQTLPGFQINDFDGGIYEYTCSSCVQNYYGPECDIVESKKKSFFRNMGYVGTNAQFYIYAIAAKSDWGGYIMSGSSNKLGGSVPFDITVSGWTIDGENEFLFTIGTNIRSESKSIAVSKTNDEYVVLGSLWHETAQRDIVFSKFTTSNEVIWHKTIVSPEMEETFTIIYLSNGNIAIGGYTDDGIAGFYVTVVDSDGEIIWSRSSHTFKTQNSLTETHDGHILLFSGAQGVHAIKLNSATGGTMWKYRYSSQSFKAKNVVLAQDNGFYLFGHTTAAPLLIQKQDLYIVKIDSSGNLVFSKNYGITGASSNYLYAYQGIQDSNGNLVFCGGFSSSSSGVIFKITADGETVIWAKKANGVTYFTSVLENEKTGEYIVSGRDGLAPGSVLLTIPYDGDVVCAESPLIDKGLSINDIGLTRVAWSITITSTGWVSEDWNPEVQDIEFNYESDVCDSQCRENFDGAKCEETTCFGVSTTESENLICSGHGTCISYDKCYCDLNYHGEECEYQISGVESILRSINGTNNDRIRSVSISLSDDGGYVACGETNSYGSGDYYGIFLLKISADGKIENKVVLGDTNYDSCFSISSTQDGGFLIGGVSRNETTTTENSNSSFSMIMKFSSTSFGSIDWSGKFGFGLGQGCYDVLELSEDKEIVCVGYILDTDYSKKDFFVSLISSRGDMLWSRVFNSIGFDDTAISVTESSSGGHPVIVGSSGNNSIVCAKINRFSGDVMWRYSYGNGKPKSISSTSDGGFLISGSCSESPEAIGLEDIFILKINLNGDIVFSFNYGITDQKFVGISIFESYGGSIIIGGNSMITDEGYLLELSSDGQSIIMEKKFDFPIFDITENYYTGDYAVVGYKTNISDISYFSTISFDGDSCQKEGPGFGFSIETFFRNSSLWNVSTNLVEQIESNEFLPIFSSFAIDASDDVLECVSCKDDYFGDKCEVVSCFGFFSNETTISCNEHGNCKEKDICTCDDYYFGDFCNQTTCDGLWMNEEDVCNGNGECEGYNKCDCYDNFYGEFCDITTCFGYFSNETKSNEDNNNNNNKICGGRGLCIGTNECKCDDFYFGVICNLTTCSGNFSNETTRVCSGNGKCVSHDSCLCYGLDYYGQDCENIETPESIFSVTLEGSSGSTISTSIIEIKDETEEEEYYISCGYTNSYGVGNKYSQMYSKWDKNGNNIFKRVIRLNNNNEEEDEKCLSIKETNDKRGYISVGERLFSKFNSNFSDVEWSISFTSISYDLVDVLELSETGDFFILGNTKYYPSSTNDIFIGLFNSTGSLQWSYLLQTSNSEYSVRCIESKDDGNIVLLGEGNGEIIIIKINSISGGIIWKYSYGKGIPYSISEVEDDGSFIITGAVMDSNIPTEELIGGSDIFLMRIDSTGSNVLFSENYGVYGLELVGSSLVIDSSGQFVVISGYDNETNGVILKISIDDQNIIWKKRIKYNDGTGKELSTSIHQIIENSDWTFIFIGQVSSGMFVSKILTNGRVCGEKESENGFSLKKTNSSLGFSAKYWDGRVIETGWNITFYSNSNNTARITKFQDYEIFLKCDNCRTNFFGEYCNITSCDGIFSNFTKRVCNSGNGKCIDYNTCDCDEYFYGEYCSVYECGGFYSNETSICNDLGICDTPGGEFCSCEGNFRDESNCKNCSDFWYGEECVVYVCGGFYSNETSEEICNSHGICTVPGSIRCTCDDFYHGLDCSVFECGGFYSNDTMCEGHGNCFTPGADKCACATNYFGDDCGLFSCNNITATDTDRVCNGHGSCIDLNTCICFTGYSNNPDSEIPCDDWYCGTHYKSDIEVCNSRGTCINSHLCECRDNYEGSLCETWSCGYDYKFSELTCSGNGECIIPDVCECNDGFIGEDCSTNIYLATVMAPILSISGFGFLAILVMIFVTISICVYCLFFLFCCVVCCLCCLIASLGCVAAVFRLRMKKFSKLKNFDILIKEQEMEEDLSIAHLKVNRSLFEVNYEKIKIVGILGQGGSSSVVYLAKWSGTDIAFKCFKTRNLCTNQNQFDEFEREVEIMSSINHPNIVQFLGATLNPPRVGILMEFCSEGELIQYFQKYRDLKKKKNKGKIIIYPLIEKIRMMNEIASSLCYLHELSIIHRDLKSENVLLDRKEATKLMDFGLSRLVDRMSQAKTTRIGTAFYMAPEIINDANYNEKCDVFSFAILIYIMITENENPYSNESMSYGIELKVSSDENFRPNMEVFNEKLKEQFELDASINNNNNNLKKEEFLKWMSDIVTTCWSHNSNKRYSTQELTKMFLEKREELGNELDEKKNMKIIIEEEEEETEKKKAIEFDIHNNNNNNKDQEQDLKEVVNKLKERLSLVEEKNEILSNENRKLFLENEDLKRKK